MLEYIIIDTESNNLNNQNITCSSTTVHDKERVVKRDLKNKINDYSPPT